ncbi:DUF4157 domain-containing protein [Microbacterium sp. dk485]|uniref:eCIS core domain-containing protein n=1 Tax=Microbacterium sp. dk485 TaxID=2560021 RepID=UPI001FD7E268|nr:DUF4157 domain-containing protein [Microbacterium sp. dk485]
MSGRQELRRTVPQSRLDVLSADRVLQLQREAGNAATSDLVEEERSPVLDTIASGGDALHDDVRADMESRLGASFGDVRVHTDAAAAQSAQSVGARAYTVGPDVVFQRDAYDPHSEEGRTTLAHELTHVMQQREGPVAGTPTAGGISVSDPGDRFERAASENASRVLSAPAPVASAVQRDIGEEGADIAGAVAQREDAAGEPEEEISEEAG